jgi:hypothetical protein
MKLFIQDDICKEIVSRICDEIETGIVGIDNSERGHNSIIFLVSSTVQLADVSINDQSIVCVPLSADVSMTTPANPFETFDENLITDILSDNHFPSKKNKEYEIMFIFQFFLIDGQEDNLSTENGKYLNR